ncbi:DNA-binding response regulator [Desulfocucumis palustris]|uniref:Stage 0 sporulation protein A homolog n=1 Tax=Desulfocucumis palustris TaxID=1898651 RepID=A0A2L2XKF3_9FIRM|nr:response regulator transcription factor [Desulfocucumis palustris]GBF34766.1 DNA-binding response regulator [Desulfocucumis palustris]
MRLILVDDHKIMRDGLRTLIERQKDVEIVAEAEDGITAVQLARELSPDFIIMDISLPNLNGVDATRKITSENPNIKVIALTMYSDKWSLKKMLRAGASGYLAKDCNYDELIQALHTVKANNYYLSSGIARTVINEYIHLIKSSDYTGSVLTARERQVLQLIAEGKTTVETASMLNLSKKTVEAHRSQIMNKLGLYNLPELVKYAVREGLTSI